jgi:hypothetical protein
MIPTLRERKVWYRRPSGEVGLDDGKPAKLRARSPKHMESIVSTDTSNGPALPKVPNSGSIRPAVEPYLGNVG